MNKLFIPFELALLAKEKGFNEPCFKCYHTENNLAYNIKKGWLDIRPEEAQNPRNFNDKKLFKKFVISAPLYQQIVEWFYEKYGLAIVVKSWDGDGQWKIYKHDKSKLIKQGIAMFVYNQYNKKGLLAIKGGWTEAIEEAFKLI